MSSYGLQWPKSGPNLVGEYQISGLPFVTASQVLQGSTCHLHFPYVTRFFTILNTGTANIEFGFTQNGTNGTNKFLLWASQSYTGEIRTKDLFFTAPTAGTTGSFSVMAGMTMVRDDMFPTLTASAAPENLPPGSSSFDFGYFTGLG